MSYDYYDMIRVILLHIYYIMYLLYMMFYSNSRDFKGSPKCSRSQVDTASALAEDFE